MNKTEVYKSLLSELRKVSAWCKNPGAVEDFEIDILFKKTLDKYQLTMNFGVLNSIYALIDTMCDSIRHHQKLIKENYTVPNGILDLDGIITLIETERIDELESNCALKEKLNNLYD